MRVTRTHWGIALVLALFLLAGMPMQAGADQSTDDQQHGLPAAGDTQAAPTATHGAAQATQITGCGIIDTPGQYVLGGDIINASPDQGVCLYINSSNVVFDGAGHKIDGQDDQRPDGIVVSRVDSRVTNITVRDVNLTDWDSGLFAGAYDSGIPDGATDIHLQNVSTVGNDHAIDFRAVRNATIERSTVRDNGFDAVRFFDETDDLTSGNSTLADNRIHNNSGRGIDVGGDNYTVRNNTIAGQSDHGIATNGDDTLVVGNTITGGDSAGINVKSTSENSNNTIVDNTVTRNNRGIRTDGNDHRIANNTVRASDRGGIRVSTFGDFDEDYNSTIVNNTVVNNGQERSSPAVVFDLFDSVNYTVRNNTIRANDGIGIRGDGDNHTVVDNTVLDNTDTGIVLRGNESLARDNDVRGNDVGISIPGNRGPKSSRDITVRDNRIKFNFGPGIEVQAQRFGHTISDNIVSTNDGSGLAIRNSPNNTVSDNRIVRNNLDGVQVVDSDNNTLRNNTIRLNGGLAIRPVGASSSTTVSRVHLGPATTVSFTGGDIGIAAGNARPGDPDEMRALGSYIDLTTNDNDGASVVLDIRYTDSQVASLNESDLQALRWNGAIWESITARNTVDTGQNVVSTNVTGLTDGESTLVTVFDRVPAVEGGLFVNSVSPRLVRSPDSFTLTATGGGFENASVVLESPTGGNVSPTSVSRANTSLDASFSLSDPQVGVWELVVADSTGETVTSPVFVPAAEPLVEIRDSWPDAVVPGRETSARIDITNRGIAEGRAIVGVEMANETSVHNVTNIDSADRVLVNESDQIILAKHLDAGESTHVGVRYSLNPGRVQFPNQAPSENRTIELGDEFTSGLVGHIGTFNDSEWQAVKNREPINISVEAMDRTLARHGRIGGEFNESNTSAVSRFMRATTAENSPGGAYLATLFRRMTGSGWVAATTLNGSTGSTQGFATGSAVGPHDLPPIPVDGTVPDVEDALKTAGKELCEGGPVPDYFTDAAFNVETGANVAKRLAQGGLRYGGKRYAGTFSKIALRSGQVAEGANAVGWMLIAAEGGWKIGKEAERQINQYFESITPEGQEAPTWGEVGGEGLQDWYPGLIDAMLKGQNALQAAERYLTSYLFDDRTECSRQETQASFDPNDISVTPEGVGDAGYITPNRTLEYRIRFENLENATAAARDVRVSLPVDDALDFQSIETQATSHPDVLSVTKDEAAREILWEFENIDLPPNENPPEGEGWITFTAQPRDGLSTGTTISENASIVFDFNPPIETNVVNNTIDRNAPETQVGTVNDTNATTVEVPWTGSDDATGSGVESVTLMAAAGDGPFEPVVNVSAAEDNLTFEGTPGETYRLATSAQDTVGNIERAPDEADATVTVCGRGPPPIVEDNRPCDPDDDGLYEDVRADGEVNILDVQELFNNLENPDLQNNARNFNFHPAAPDEVTILDVQGLFNRLPQVVSLASTPGRPRQSGTPSRLFFG